MLGHYTTSPSRMGFYHTRAGRSRAPYSLSQNVTGGPTVPSTENVTEGGHAGQGGDDDRRATEVHQADAGELPGGRPRRTRAAAVPPGGVDRPGPQDLAPAAARGGPGAAPAGAAARSGLRDRGGRRGAGDLGAPRLRVCRAADAGPGADGAAAGPARRAAARRGAGRAVGADQHRQRPASAEPAWAGHAAAAAQGAGGGQPGGAGAASGRWRPAFARS